MKSVVFALVILAAVPAVAGEPGKALFEAKGCSACHGEAGSQPVPGAPVLSGQNASYLFKQLKDLAEERRVARKGADGAPRSAVMQAQAKQLSADEMKQMADWLASLPGLPAKGKAMAEGDGLDLFIDHGCNGCHGTDGRKPLTDYPLINGQKKDYLALQIKDIRDDVRTNGRARLMISFARDLTDAQADTIAAALAGQ